MKISECIKKLEKIKSKKGDLPMYWIDDDTVFYEVEPRLGWRNACAVDAYDICCCDEEDCKYRCVYI